MEPQMELEEAGRGTDAAAAGGTMAHLSLGEVVIPREFMSDPEVQQMLMALFEQNGANLAEFTVGDPANKINPETGYPEFGFFKSIKKILGAVAPAALAYFAPGIGTALGSSILGAGTLGSATLGNALIGGGIGALTGGGLKGALTGAAGGALGANIGSLGGELQGPTQSGATLGGVSGRSGILGALGEATGLTNNSLPSIGGITEGISGGGGSSFSPTNLAANAFGAYNQEEAIKKQKQALLGANQQQMANLESFDPSGITSDPGYQFNLEQGQKGLNQGLAAGGSLFSGKALKAASKYNQDYANNAFSDYYQRWLQKTQGQNQLYGSAGDVNANAAGASSQNLAQSLSNALGTKVGGYGNTGGLTLQQLKALGLA